MPVILKQVVLTFHFIFRPLLELFLLSLVPVSHRPEISHHSAIHIADLAAYRAL
jgi:hypothetical protein